jgi:hypothetical protein
MAAGSEGYQVVVQAWDFRAGSDFVQQVHQTVEEASGPSQCSLPPT